GLNTTPNQAQEAVVSGSLQIRAALLGSGTAQEIQFVLRAGATNVEKALQFVLFLTALRLTDCFVSVGLFTFTGLRGYAQGAGAISVYVFVPDQQVALG